MEPRQNELVSSNGEKRSLVEGTGSVYVYKTVKFVCKDGLPAREGVEVGAWTVMGDGQRLGDSVRAVCCGHQSAVGGALGG